MDKTQSRIVIKEKLELLKDKDLLSVLICNKVLALHLDCKSILLYSALSNEVNVDKLIEYYLKKCDVYLPKVKGEELVIIKIDRNTPYALGAFGIKEPIGEEIEPEDANIDVCITPLLGFDENLNRLGKGKGYYDRFFAKCKTYKIGVAFEAQKIDCIDSDKFDIQLNKVVTEDRIYENN